MNFNDYQKKSRKTAKYPAIGHPVIYPALGLVNEAGEVAGKIKKGFRDKDGEISDETRAMLQVPGLNLDALPFRNDGKQIVQFRLGVRISTVLRDHGFNESRIHQLPDPGLETPF